MKTLIRTEVREGTHSRQNQGYRLTLDQKRQVALRTLVALLEAGSPAAGVVRSATAENIGNPASRLARLQNAHAAYMLKTGHGMLQIRTGVWIRERQRARK